jgi:FkbM family methyltransferase
MALLSVFQPAMRRMRSAGRVLADLARIGSQLGELRASVARLGQVVDDLRKTRPGSIYLGDHVAIARTRRGQRIFVDSRDVAIGIHLLTEGVWEEWIARRFERLLRPGATVIEVGANVGYYTLLGASLIGPMGRYYAFEANPHVSRLLNASVSINGFLDRVTIFHKAAHRERRTIPFYVLERYPGSSSIHPFGRELLEQVQDEARAVEVEAVALDEVFADESFKVDLVKIDAEGSEPHVFRGMERLLRRSGDVKIICEFDRGMLAASEDPRQFVDFVTSLGFRFSRIDPPHGDLAPLSVDELLASAHIEVLLER